ncbi:hypothetical protein KER40_20005 [Escherichia coli]|nr:hypothetical protein [Escherichia coli]
MSDNNLRLQVILNAVDKLTRPFRAAQASSKELAGAIQNTRNSLKELNKQAGRIEAPTQIIIQTQPGQSAQDIAREVARQLDERERRLKAKARSNYSDQGGYDA